MTRMQFDRKIVAAIALIVSAILLTAASPKPVSSPSTWRVSSRGLGPLRIGMTSRQVERVLGVSLMTWDRDPAKVMSLECDEPGFDGYPGLGLLFENDRLDSIDLWIEKTPHDGEVAKRGESDVDLTGVATDTGLKLGAPEADVRRVYGQRLQIEARPYDGEPSHQLSFWDTRDHRGIVFDTNERGLIDRISVGGRSIYFMEGCL